MTVAELKRELSKFSDEDEIKFSDKGKELFFHDTEMKIDNDKIVGILMLDTNKE